MNGGRGAVGGGRTIGRYLAGALVVGLLVVIGTAVRVAATAGQDERGRVDAIVVLGAAQYNGTPSPIFAARLDHAAELFAGGVAPRIVTVGGSQPGDKYTEADAGKAYLIEHGISDTSITAVGDGNDTLVSLQAGSAVIEAAGWTSIVLVTDPWHAYRAGLIAGDLGLQVSVSSVQVGPATGTDVAPRYLFRETLGVLFYRLIGGSSGAGTPVI